jgi:uronate dehydrogenase
MKRILLTGAAGGVAGMIRPLMRADYEVRLSDRRPVADRVGEEEEAPADLGDVAALRKAIAGVDGIVHLGGYPLEAEWEVIHAANIVGCYNLFEVAREEGVRRIVFASSNHAVGFYPRQGKLGHDVSPRPDSRYGLSKAFGESLGALYAYKYGASVMSIRIGNVALRPMDVRRLSIWVSPRDLYQLIRIGLETIGMKHEIVYGASNNSRSWWDNSNALRLGYRPQDSADAYADAVLAGGSGKTGDDRVDLNQGGPFCVAETM